MTYLVLKGMMEIAVNQEKNKMERTNAAFMSGVPEFLVLRLLSQQSMYGYELVKTIRLATGEAIRLGEGVVYPVLHSLERNGSLRSRKKTHQGRTRVYYQLTPKGRRRLERLSNDWQRISGGVDAVLKGA